MINYRRSHPNAQQSSQTTAQQSSQTTASQPFPIPQVHNPSSQTTDNQPSVHTYEKTGRNLIYSSGATDYPLLKG